MTDLTVFNFESNNVRIITIEEEAWFVAMDLAKILEYADSAKMLSLVDEEDK